VININCYMYSSFYFYLLELLFSFTGKERTSFSLMLRTVELNCFFV